MMNKKSIGFLADLFTFIVGSFVLCFFIGIMFYIRPQFTEAFEEATNALNENTGAENMTIVIQSTLTEGLKSLDVFKWGVLLIIGSMILSVIMSSFLVTQHPVIIVPYLFVLLIAVMISAPISNTYEELINDEDLGEYFNLMPSANYVVLYLPHWVTIIGFLGIIIMGIRWTTKEKGVGYIG